MRQAFRKDEPRPADVTMYRGVTSETELEYPTEPYPVELDPDAHDDAPIPVIVVDSSDPSDYTDWAGEGFTVDTVPIHIAGARDNRKRLLVRNTGPDTVFLTRGAVSGVAFGYPLPIGAEVEMTHNRDVWAVCANTESAVIGVIQEYVIDNGD